MAAKPTFNGRLYLNIGEPMHRRIYRAAEKAGQSMTKFATKLIKEGLARNAHRE